MQYVRTQDEDMNASVHQDTRVMELRKMAVHVFGAELAIAILESPALRLCQVHGVVIALMV